MGKRDGNTDMEICVSTKAFSFHTKLMAGVKGNIRRHN